VAIVDVKAIKSSADDGRCDEALAACESLLRDDPENKADILRARAYVFGLQDDFTRALRDREAVLAMGAGTLKDFYRAGDNALYAGDLKKAVCRFEEVLRLGEAQNEKWFESATYLLMAYAHMELGDYAAANKNADAAAALEADCAMPLPGVGMCNVDQLRQEIMRRAR
jgi:tetratricopeptide (TPR) repeat protein